MREVVTSTDILTFFRTQSFERLARLVITISADDDYNPNLIQGKIGVRESFESKCTIAGQKTPVHS
jgi:hypothetical protein